jgi:hypothetical protein
MIRTRIAECIAACTLIGAGRLAAQTVTTCTVTGASGKCSPSVTLDQPATITNPALLALTVSPSSSSLSPLSLTASATDMDVATGLSSVTTVTLVVQANRAWTVQVSGATPVWGATAGAWTSKPVSDLRWSLSPTGTATPLSVTSATAVSGTAGPGGAGTPLYFRPVVHWLTDKPGVYTMDVVVTLTTP